MIIAMVVINDAVKEMGKPEGATFTSGPERESKHSFSSLHYNGCAVDVRTRYFTDDEKYALGDMLRQRLTDEFDVVVESTHIHVEYQPKRP